MTDFEELLTIADTLLGPNGCPWDKEQTFDTLKPYILEETHELLEAIDLAEGPKIEEELGDCFYALVFVAKLAEQREIFTLREALRKVGEKLIRRHPHIFGDLKVDTPEEVVRNWDEIKKKEGKKSPIEGIPPSLPALARAQKVIRKLKAAKGEAASGRSEEDWGERLWSLVRECEASGHDAESALRRYCLMREKEWTESNRADR